MLDNINIIFIIISAFKFTCISGIECNIRSLHAYTTCVQTNSIRLAKQVPTLYIVSSCFHDERLCIV